MNEKKINEAFSIISIRLQDDFADAQIFNLEKLKAWLNDQIDNIELLKNRINLPIIANGGASDLQSFEELFNKTEIASACAGTTFVYFGPRKAVLINYPSTYSVDKIMNQHSINL